VLYDIFDKPQDCLPVDPLSLSLSRMVCDYPTTHRRVTMAVLAPEDASLNEHLTIGLEGPTVVACNKPLVTGFFADFSLDLFKHMNLSCKPDSISGHRSKEAES
jgi:hypothetical protein